MSKNNPVTLDERIAALTEAEAKMTPKPWVTRSDLGESWAKSIYTSPGYGRILGDCEAVTDAAGIVALRNSAVPIIAELRAELDAAQGNIDGVVSGLRSHLADLISRIGPARRPEDIKAALEDIHNSYNTWGDHSSEKQLATARAELATWHDIHGTENASEVADALRRVRLQRDEALARERGLREALEQIRDMEPREFTGFPEDWQKQVEECSECQRYKGHPIQRGICDKHRDPIWAREAHNKREGGTGMRFRMLGIASAAIAEKGTTDGN